MSKAAVAPGDEIMAMREEIDHLRARDKAARALVTAALECATLADVRVVLIGLDALLGCSDQSPSLLRRGT